MGDQARWREQRYSVHHSAKKDNVYNAWAAIVGVKVVATEETANGQ
jgi:hypothetical protein